MGIPLISPLLWRAVPFDDSDAYLDFAGSHQQWHRELATVTKTRIVQLDDLRENLDLHAQMHNDVADALQIPNADDLRSYDLMERDAFEVFMLVHSSDHERLRLAAGL